MEKLNRSNTELVICMLFSSILASVSYHGIAQEMETITSHEDFLDILLILARLPFGILLSAKIAESIGNLYLAEEI